MSRVQRPASGILRLIAAAMVALSTLTAAEGRGILVCTAADAPPALRAAAAQLVADAERIPLFAALRRTQGAGAPEAVESATLMDEKKEWNRAAFNHLVVIGLPGRDPLLDKVRGWQIHLDATAKSAYQEGFGSLAGDLGSVECDRNPFLHSPRIDTAAFDTCVVKVSGTSEAGVLAALAAFRGGLANGLVPVGTPTRPQTTLLDLDPSLEAPPGMAALPGGAACAGWHMCPANEYRAVLEAGGVEPQRLWRLKWLLPSAWDGMGAKPWLAGMHRMAFANAASLARFADAAAATRAAEAVAKGAHGKPAPAVAGEPVWELEAPSDEAIDPGDVPPTLVTSHGAFLVLATLTAEQVAALVATLPR